MPIAAPDFRNFAINPALTLLATVGIPYSQCAADLVMATAAVESSLGTYLHQEAGGPALGIFQEDPDDLTNLQARLTSAQLAALETIASPEPMATQIETNLKVAAFFCRIHYWYATSDPLPARTAQGLWQYYKSEYNSVLGATTQAEFNDSLKLTDIVF